METETLTESKDLNNGKENDRTVDLTSETQTDTQGKRECLNNTNTDKIPADLTRGAQLNALVDVDVEDLNDGGVNERTLTSDVPVTIVTTGSRSPGRGEGYHRGQYWIPC